MEDFNDVAADLQSLAEAVANKAKSYQRQRELVDALAAAAQRTPPNISAIRRLIALPAQKELRESFDDAGGVLDALHERARNAWSDFELNFISDFRQLATGAGLEVHGQPPKLSVGRGVEVVFKLKENKTIVNGVSIQSVDPMDVFDKVRAEHDRLWGGTFDAEGFMRDLHAAYQAELSNGRASTEGVPIRAIYERMRGSLKASAKKTFTADVFAAQISRALEAGARAPGGLVLELRPVRDTRDALFVYLPDQRERAHRGLVTFREGRA